MEQLGAVGLILAEGSLKKENVFSFLGDLDAISDFFNELKGYVPKRKSRAKASGAATRQRAPKPKPEAEEKSQSEIWLL